MQTINLLDIHSDGLKKGFYLRIIPEYYKLRDFTENNSWHNKQNVFDHCISVFENMERLFNYKIFTETEKSKFDKYLQTKVGNVSRKEILILSVLLHDISKSETLIKCEDGTTKCPGHEIASAGMVSLFSKRFGINHISENHIKNIVGYHGFISDILGLMISKNDKNKYFDIFTKTVGDVALELTILMYADDMGSDLSKNNHKLFETRMELIKWMFSKLLEI